MAMLVQLVLARFQQNVGEIVHQRNELRTKSPRRAFRSATYTTASVHR